ncbi:MAG TPA: endonuclease/exonuclease/phosphatase family protein [Myxococcaceae bacterium]|nr:endonuclease/exonuclease/phosphatase family protein [Myxococcaceae bacterium]
MIEAFSFLEPLLPRSLTPADQLPVSRTLSPHRDPTLVFHSFKKLPKTHGPRELGDGRTLLIHNTDPSPDWTPELVVMSYNILLGGERREALDQYFKDLLGAGRLPEIIGLQEARQPTAVRLAERFGFHLAYQGRDGETGQRIINGKAILSLHPIVEAAHYTYGLTDSERAAVIARRGDPCELEEDRGVLRAVLDVNGRRVAVYNIHHALGDAGVNANNLRQLNALLRQHRDPIYIVMGDFNVNTMIKGSGYWPGTRLKRRDDTHTMQAYRKRYGYVVASVGDPGVGNIADPRVRHELEVLERRCLDAFDRSPLVMVRLHDGSIMTPEQARARLNSGEIPRGTETWRRLQDIADASTLAPMPNLDGVVPATGKRLDTVCANRALKPCKVEVDHSTEASDHLAVIVTYRFEERSNAS